MRRRIICCFLFVLFLVSCGESGGGEFPSRPITYIVPWAPGGGTDASSRAMAVALGDILGRSVNVVNRTGGGGVVGHLALSQAQPDGYTIGAMTVEITLLHWLGLTPLTFEDYTPLALLINNPAAVTVRADAPWETIGDLLESVRQNPGRHRVSGSARGGVWDVARVGFLQAAGFEESDMPYVPSQGAAPALQQLISGGIDVVTAAVPEVNALRQAGQVKTLGVMADERLEAFPDVPTVREQGVDYSLGGWVSIAAPAGLPDDVRATLIDAIERAARNPSFTEPMTRAGFNIQFISAERFEEFLAEENRRNGELMRAAGFAQ